MSEIHEIEEVPFMCVVCHEEYPPPWFQCGNGHITCPQCYRALPDVVKLCPTCRIHVPIPIRNLALEKFVQQHTPDIPVKCPRDGCPLRLPLSGLAAHSAKCPYIPVVCVYGKDKCPWRGPRHGMYLHLMEKHEASILAPTDEGDFKLQWSGVFNEGLTTPRLLPVNKSGGEGHIYALSSQCNAISARLFHLYWIEGNNATGLQTLIDIKVRAWSELTSLVVKMKGTLSIFGMHMVLPALQRNGKIIPFNLTIQQYDPDEGKPPRKKQKIAE